MSDIKRKKNESFEAFMRRVKTTWQRSGRILETKKKQYYVPLKSKNLRKKKAVEFAQKKAKLAYLLKIGKLPAEEAAKMNRVKDRQKQKR